MEYEIIVGGNLKDGFWFVGPFESSAEALEYAERNFRQTSWWICTMTGPEERE